MKNRRGAKNPPPPPEEDRVKGSVVFTWREGVAKNWRDQKVKVAGIYLVTIASRSCVKILSTLKEAMSHPWLARQTKGRQKMHIWKPEPP